PVVANPDGSSLAFDLPAHPAGMAVDPVTGVVVWVPTADEAGDQTVVLRAADSQGRVVVQSFHVVVGLVDQPPVITSTPPAQAVVGVAWQYQARAQSSTGAKITFGLNTGPMGLSVDPATGLVTWTPTAAETGAQHVILTASDPAGAETVQEFFV